MIDSWSAARSNDRHNWHTPLRGAMFVAMIFTAGFVWTNVHPRIEIRERRHDGAVYREEVGPDGELHGTQRIYVDDRLVCERIFSRGFLMRAVEYNLDGTVKSVQVHED